MKGRIAECEPDQNYSPRSFTSSLGDSDDIQKTGMCIFILASYIHCGYRLTAHFSHTQAGPFLDLCAVRGISQTSRGIKW